MAQPKTPPLSIRPGEERLAKIDAHAAKRGMKRHAAVLELIDAGLKAHGPGLPSPAEQARMKSAIGAIQEARAKVRELTIEPDVAAQVARLREVHDRPYVHFGPVARKPGSMLRTKK